MTGPTSVDGSVPGPTTSFATPAEPTNEIAATSGFPSSVSTDAFAPWTTWRTPSGTPASIASSASLTDVSGVRCEGFSTNVFPATIASGNIHSGIIAGKL